VEVRINDRGPFTGGRIIDLSKAAAELIGMTARGIARVSITVLGH
jgi:rare lipoprotein A